MQFCQAILSKFSLKYFLQNFCRANGKIFIAYTRQDSLRRRNTKKDSTISVLPFFVAPQARGQAAIAFGDFRHRELATRTGRNYKLLPALATNSPPDCLRSASRPQRFKVSVKLRRVAAPPYEIKLSAYKSNDFYKKMRFTGNETH